MLHQFTNLCLGSESMTHASCGRISSNFALSYVGVLIGVDFTDRKGTFVAARTLRAVGISHGRRQKSKLELSFLRLYLADTIC